MEEKFQIKNADGKYVSIGMDGKPKWFASPDMGYTYTKEEAETFKVILEGMNFPNLSVVKYDKDWWKVKMNLGGSADSELARGIEVEKEHVGTLEKLVKGEISLEEAPKYIAMDHLKESKTYYTELDKMESKFSGGGPTSEGMLKIINQDPTVITAARITKQPKELGDAMPQVFVTINGKEQYLFEYYPDEISFTPEDFIGKTIDESRTLKFEKDKMYLQSHSYAGGGGVIGNVRNTPSGIIYTVDYSVSTPFGSLKKFEYVNSNQVDLLTKFADGGKIVAKDAVIGDNYWIKNHKNKWTEIKVSNQKPSLEDKNIVIKGIDGLFQAEILPNTLLSVSKPKHISSSVYHLSGGGSFTHAEWVAKFNNWKQSPDFGNTLGELNDQDIDYTGWTDADIFEWHLENKRKAEQKKYYSTSRIMPFSEFIAIEVEERSNYEEEDVKHWKKKYGITDDSKVIWVALEPHIAARYQMDADDWSKAKELYEADPEKYEVDEYPASKGTLIEESDDGDDGFVMVLNDNYADGGDFLESTDLYMKEGTHDKEYHLQIVRRGNGYGVVAQYGRRGAHLSEDDKGTFSSMEEAQKEFQKVKKSKLKKGYVEDGGGKPPEPKPKPKPEPKPVPTFNTGDYFTTSSGDRYQIKSIHSSGSRMQYESVSGIKTSIDLSTAIRFFEEGSWKLDAQEYSQLVGQKIKIIFSDGDEDEDVILAIQGEGVLKLKEWKQLKDSGLKYSDLGSLMLGKKVELKNNLTIQLLSFYAPEKKLTRMEFYEKYGY